MTIEFLEKKTKQKNMVIIFIVISIITLLVFFFGFKPSKTDQTFLENDQYFGFTGQVRINFKILDNPIFEKLKAFENIESFEGEIGRENPFLPY